MKLVGDKLITRPHHAAHICALGRRSAVCNLCFMLVISLDSPLSRCWFIFVRASALV
jgi:hypothetical protein